MYGIMHCPKNILKIIGGGGLGRLLVSLVM